MPSNKPRLALTLPQHRYDLLDRLAKLQGVSKASIVTELMDQAWPVLERVCVALEAVSRMQDDVKSGFRDACDEAIAELEPLAARVTDQLDMFVGSLVAKSPGNETSGAQRSGDTGGSVPRSEASPNPRHVIRGSGFSGRGG